MERKQPDLVLIVARSFATKLATPTLIADARGELVYFNDPAAELLGRSYLDVGKLPASRWQELFKPRTLDEQPLTAEQTPSGIALLERRPGHGSVALRRPRRGRCWSGGRFTARSHSAASTGATTRSPSPRSRFSRVPTRSWE